MRPSPRLLLLAVLLTGVAAQTSAQTPNEDAKKWTVTGRVINSATRAPVTKANVSAIPQDPNSGIAPISTATAADGSFTLSGEQEALYAIIAKRAGFLDGAYGARRPGRPGTPVQLGPGDNRQNIEIPITPPATISGRAIDEEGQPINGAYVFILTEHYVRGRKNWLSAGSGRTNDLGEYRVAGLKPGKYIVSSALLNYAPPKTGESTPAYAPLFYPNGREMREAQILDLFPGTDLSGVDLFMKNAKTYRVRGLVRIPSGFDVTNPPYLILSSAGTFARNSYPIKEDNTFEVWNLAPGDYGLVVTVSAGNAKLFARTTISVDDEDINGVVLDPAPAFSVTGRLVLPDSGPKTEAGASVDLSSRSPDGQPPGSSARVNASGAFTLSDLQPGTYAVSLFNHGDAGYLAAATLDGTNVLDKEFQLSGPATLTLTAAFDPAAVSGEVTHDDKPFPGATVALIPTGARAAFPANYKFTKADASGQFRIAGIAPGEYRLFAFDDVDEGRCYDPEFIAAHNSKGVSFSAAPNGSHSFNLELIQLPN